VDISEDDSLDCEIIITIYFRSSLYHLTLYMWIVDATVPTLYWLFLLSKLLNFKAYRRVSGYYYFRIYSVIYALIYSYF
jgi:hypothetical protein